MLHRTSASRTSRHSLGLGRSLRSGSSNCIKLNLILTSGLSQQGNQHNAMPVSRWFYSPLTSNQRFFPKGVNLQETIDFPIFLWGTTGLFVPKKTHPFSTRFSTPQMVSRFFPYRDLPGPWPGRNAQVKPGVGVGCHPRSCGLQRGVMGMS